MQIFPLFQDVLENDQIKLDHMFKFSLIQDIVRVSKCNELLHYHSDWLLKQTETKSLYLC